MQMNADQTVLGYLGRALSLELSAVQLYTAQSRLLATWGLTDPAERLRAEAQEELVHVERIIARMLAHGVAPNASLLRPAGLGSDLRELLLHDQAFEHELVELYENAASYCARAGRANDRLFFEALLEEERRHALELAQWLQQLEPAEPDRRPGGASF